MSSIMKTSGQFKTEIIEIVRSMPLKEILFVPDSYVEGAIALWTKTQEDGRSMAQNDYLSYYHMITSLPNEQVLLDIDLYMFRVARRIVDSLMLSMFENNFYDTVFGHSNMDKSDMKYFMDLANVFIDRAEEEMSKNLNIKSSPSKIREDFNAKIKEIVDAE